MSPLVKICGLTRAEDALAAARAGADFLGFVFVPSSPRFITVDAAASIASAVRRLSAPPRLVGVFLDQAVEEVRSVANRVPLDLVQLHGDEPPEAVSALSIPVIKTRHVSDSLPDVSAYGSAAWLLFDRRTSHAAGGTGVRFDWSILSGAVSRPFFLAGGLNSENVADAVNRVRPAAVDVSTGVEDRPGIKSAAKIGRFMEEVRRS